MRILIFLFVFLIPVTGNADSEVFDVVCDPWPPYQVEDESKNISGISAAIVNRVLEKLGVHVNSFKVYPWKRALYELKTGNAHALFSANMTQERKEYAYYPEESLFHSPWVIWGRKNSAVTYNGFQDLSGKVVGVVQGYSYTPEFWNFIQKHSRIEEVTYDDQMFRMLQLGRVDFVVAELRNGYHIVSQLGLDNIVPFVHLPIKIDGLYIIFNKRKVPESFVKKFSDELRKYKSSLEYHRLSSFNSLP